MGDIDIDIEVDKASHVAPALRRGLREGLKNAGEWMMDEGEDKARDIVMTTDRVWRKTVKRGFSTEENQFSRTAHWKGEIRNDAPHAKIVEKGLAPAGEITGSTPSVQDIIPWVSSELTPNAKAQASADAANVDNWDPEIANLAKEYSPGIVITAFVVRESIEEEGYPGIDFMDTTESYLNQVGPRLVKQKVEKHMRRELRAAGLK
jgi:hypothetical protein